MALRSESSGFSWQHGVWCSRDVQEAPDPRSNQGELLGGGRPRRGHDRDRAGDPGRRASPHLRQRAPRGGTAGSWGGGGLLGLWGTLPAWESTGGELLGFRREPVTPHGCQGLWGGIPWGLWPSLPGQRSGIWDSVSVHRMRVLGWPVAYTVPHLEALGGTWSCPLT